MITPSEDLECRRFVDWLELKKSERVIQLFSHIANETRSKKQAIKNKSLGTRRGVPDFVIVLKYKVIFVEMKRRRRSRVSPEQQIWIDALNSSGVPAKVCRGFDEAVAFVEENLK